MGSLEKKVILEIETNIDSISVNKYARLSKYARHNVDKKAKSKFIKLIVEALGEAIQFLVIDRFSIKLEINSKKDIDNCILIIKHFVDSLKYLKLIKDDNNEFFQHLEIKSNRNLRLNHYKITLYKLP